MNKDYKMKIVAIEKKQETVILEKGEVVEIQNCTNVTNCTNHHTLYSFEEFIDTNLGAQLPQDELLTLPAGISTIYIKASEQQGTQLSVFKV